MRFLTRFKTLLFCIEAVTMWSAFLQRLRLLLTPAATPEVISRDVLAIEIIVKRYREAWNKLESFAKAHNTEMYVIAYEVSSADAWTEVNWYQFPMPGSTELDLLETIIAQGRAHYVNNPMCTITSAEAESLNGLSVATDGLDLMYQKIVEKRSVRSYGYHGARSF